MDHKSPTENLRIIQYKPPQPQSTGSDVDARPRWQQLAERIGNIPAQRIDVSSLTIDLDRIANGEKPLQIALRLASNTKSSTEHKLLRELIVVSLCSVLSTSGRATPEEIDPILSILVKGSNTKYYGQITRGAKFANEIIAEWSMTGSEDKTECLDRATQSVLQAELTLSQWAHLSNNKSRVKEYILRQTLPHKLPLLVEPPLLIPCLIEFIASPSLGLSQICQCLGYHIDLASCMADLALSQTASHDGKIVLDNKDIG